MKINALLLVLILVFCGCKSTDKETTVEETTIETSVAEPADTVKAVEPTATPQTEQPVVGEAQEAVNDNLSEDIPSCMREYITNGMLTSLYSYTFGENELVYLATSKKHTDGSSVLFAADCTEMCSYNGTEGTWSYPCASFPTRSDNEKLLYRAK